MRYGLKYKLKKWLDLPDYTERDILVLQGAFNSMLERLKNAEEEQKMYSGSIPMERGVKEHVHAIVEHLGLKPSETFTEEPVEAVTTRTRRHFKLTLQSNMTTPDTEKKPTYKEIKEEIKKTDYFKSLDEDGNPPDTEDWEKEFVEKGADLEHERWSKWQKHMHSKILPSADEGISQIGTEWVERWSRQINTPYTKLSETEKESDREQVRPYLPLIKSLLSSRDTYWKERVRKEVDGLQERFGDWDNGDENEPLLLKCEVLSLLDNLK